MPVTGARRRPRLRSALWLPLFDDLADPVVVARLARRRLVKVARETVTLDRLSGGRLTLGAGLGSIQFLPRPVQRPGVPLWAAGFPGNVKPLHGPATL